MIPAAVLRGVRPTYEFLAFRGPLDESMELREDFRADSCKMEQFCLFFILHGQSGITWSRLLPMLTGVMCG